MSPGKGFKVRERKWHFGEAERPKCLVQKE